MKAYTHVLGKISGFYQNIQYMLDGKCDVTITRIPISQSSPSRIYGRRGAFEWAEQGDDFARFRKGWGFKLW